MALDISARGLSQLSDDLKNQKLTTAYIQHEAVEVQTAMVGSSNHTVIHTPSGPNGVPNVGTFVLGAPKK